MALFAFQIAQTKIVLLKIGVREAPKYSSYENDICHGFTDGNLLFFHYATITKSFINKNIHG